MVVTFYSLPESKMNMKVSSVSLEGNINTHTEEQMSSHKTIDNEEAYDVYVNTAVFKTMKPLFQSLQVFGLYHAKNYGPVKDYLESKLKNGKRFNKKECEKRITLSMVNAWIVFAIFLIYYLRMYSTWASGSLSFGEELLNKLTLLSHYSLLFLSLLACIRASHNFNAIPKFCIEFDRLLKERDIELDLGYLRKLTVMTVGFSWASTILGTGVLSYCTWLNPVVNEFMFAPLALDDKNIFILKIIVQILTPHAMAFFFMPLALDFILCMCLFKLFQRWRDCFRQKSSKGLSTQDFIKERHNHQKICHLVDNVNDILSLYKAACFLFNTANVLFILYSMINIPAGPGRVGSMLAHAAWMGMCFGTLMLTCINSACVHSMVSSIKVF